MNKVFKNMAKQLPFVFVGALILYSSVVNDRKITELVEKNSKLAKANTELINKNLKSIQKGVCLETDLWKSLNAVYEPISYNRNKIMDIIDGEINICGKE